MRRIPEQRDGLGEDKAVLDVPVDLLRQGLTDAQRATEEALERTTRLGDVDVRNLVEGHEDRCKQGVHQHADTKGDKGLAPAEVAGKPLGGFAIHMEATIEQFHRARLEDGHGRGDDHAQHAPNEHLGQQAEALLHINTLADAQGQHLTKGAEDGELEEAHQQAVVIGSGIKPFPGAWDEGEAADDGAR